MQKHHYSLVILIVVFFNACNNKPVHRDVQLSTLPGPVIQRIVYEFGDTSKVSQLKIFSSPRKSYDEGSIGRKLSADEWRASQAWQSLAGYNMAKVSRLRGMNGMVWCTLRGGGNSVTYMKPLIDFEGHAKLAFYGFRQAIQPVFPASVGVDVVYGPDDRIQPVIMNLGGPHNVDLTVRIKNMQGKVVYEKTFHSVRPTNDRKPVVLPAFKPSFPAVGFYAIEYEVIENKLTIGHTFEFKYFSNDTKANGETDFSGNTEVFSTDQRIAFLNNYYDYATRYFDDTVPDKMVVTDSEVQAALAKFKPQPLPSVRERIPLNDGWKWLAYREDETSQNMESLKEWQEMKGSRIQDGHLVITRDNVKFTKTFTPQRWRFFIQWQALASSKSPLSFTLGDGKKSAITVEYRQNGKIFCLAAGEEHDLGPYDPGKWQTIRVETDLDPASKSFSVYVDGDRKIYAASLSTETKLRSISAFTVKGSKDDALDELWGVGYDLAADNLQTGTYAIATFVDQNFEIKAPVTGWTKPDYDAQTWNENGTLPLVTGSERNSGRDVYMRRIVKTGNFKKAFLNIEALDPGGEIYINDKLVATLNRQPARLDISDFLEKNKDNLLAVKVNHVPDVYYPADGHTSQDRLYGWFAARMSMDITDPVHIENAVVRTEAIGKSAIDSVIVDIVNESESAFTGYAEVKFTPWYPTEGSPVSAGSRFPLKIGAGAHSQLRRTVLIPDYRLWSYDSPFLYKVSITLVHDGGQPVDDYIVTTGIRTVRHENGIFLLNGKPDMLNGATAMQFVSPLEEMTEWHRCLPEEWIARYILMAKAAGMNTLRMHTPSCAYSDPRFAEYGDQLGIMYLWVPTGWERSDWVDIGDKYLKPALDLAGHVAEYVTDMKLVMNHPSIVMWEIFNESVKKERQEMLFNAFYPEVYKTDGSRLISFLKGYKPEKPVPGLINSFQNGLLGYGAKWSRLRDDAAKPNSDLYAVEFAELAGQDNWDLARCKPWYHIHSYEWSTTFYQVSGLDPKTGQLREVVIPEPEPKH